MVSVVIPVYNAAPWLRQCLDSVVGQTLREIEIICVDDGSTDESPQILEEYAQADERVRILHQQNQYAGVARNNGLAHASGKYIIFWDSDDYFDLDALRLMVNGQKKQMRMYVSAMPRILIRIPAHFWLTPMYASPIRKRMCSIFRTARTGSIPSLRQSHGISWYAGSLW